MKKINVAIMGLGTVGGGTYDILTTNHDMILKTQGVDIQVTKILDKAIDRLVARGIDRSIITTNLDDILSDKTISVVVEVMGGVEPAKTFISKVLASGKSVVTANKELLSKSWYELEKIAKDNGVGLYFEASCVGGVPIIRTLITSMQANNIQELYGIINGTTNYILTKMTDENMSYEKALAEAQSLGYAEFNPSADVDGYDAMYKLSILSSLAFHESLPYTYIYREGISKITSADIFSAKELGYTIKLLAIGRKEGNQIEIRVHPTFVPNDHPLASVRGAFNAVFLKGDFVDDIMLYGRGAGAKPTGSAIVSDIVVCAKNENEHEYASFDNNGKLGSGLQIVSDFMSKYYLALSVVDRAGVLAKITAILGTLNVSISTIIQRGVVGGYASVILLTHETGENSIQQAVKQLEALNEIRKVDSLIRVI